MNAISDAYTNKSPSAFENFVNDLLENDESTAAELPSRRGYDISQGLPKLLHVEKQGTQLNIFVDLRLDRIEQLNVHILGSGVFEVEKPHVYPSESTFDSFSNSTDSDWFRNMEPEGHKINLDVDVEEIFTRGEFAKVESGMINDFSLGLERLIGRHGKLALDHIQKYILEESATTYLAMEALKHIGSFDLERLHHQRRIMMENCLRESRFAWVRDGASLGLSFMDDPQSIPSLKDAIASETNEELREDLKQVLEQLEETLLES